MDREETDAAFVDRMVGGMVGDLDDDERYQALNVEERRATLVWVALGRIAADGWAGWASSLGHRTGDLVEALQAIGASELARVARQLDDPAGSSSGAVAKLERKWSGVVRATRPVENDLAPWIRRHPTEMPSTVDDL
jgi:hypothetical protein